MPKTFTRLGIEAILNSLNLAGCSLEVTFISDARMRRLNQRFMGKRGTTDVLSFPCIATTPQDRANTLFQGQFLGDILVSLDQAKRQAGDLRMRLRDEVLFLLVHSILHLIGYDHATSADRKIMNELESRLWQGLHRVRTGQKK